MAFAYDVPFQIDLTGRRALVTGGNGGIGGTFCRALAACGCEVFVLGRNEEKSRAVADEINAGGGIAHVVTADVTNEASMRGVYEDIKARCAGLNLLINAAGGNGFDQLFVSNGRYLVHFFGPLLTLVSYLGFETDPLPAARDSWLALVPTLIYAAVIYTLNYLRVLEGPYPFFRVWSMPLWQTAAWFVALLILAWLLARVTRVAARWIATSRARRR